MALFEFIVEKDVTGRSDGESFSNSYHLRINLDIASPVLLEIADALVAAEKTAMLNIVRFIKCHIVHKADNTINSPDKSNFVTKYYDEAGARAVVGDIAPPEMVLRVNRFCTTGRAGQMSYRYCLLESDIDMGPRGKFVATTPATFTAAGALIGKLNGGMPGSAEFVIPNKASLLLQTGRKVEKHVFGGIETLQLQRKRLPAASAHFEGSRRQVQAIQRTIKKMKSAPTAVAQNPDTAAAIVSLKAQGIAIIEAVSVEQRGRFYNGEFLDILS